MATYEDIAQALGISKSTVSKALTGAKDVSKKTQKQVIEKAVELGYIRNTRNMELPRIALFIINMEYEKPDDFGYDIIVGFRQAAEPAGYQVEVIPLTQTFQTETRYDEYMMAHKYVGGFFLGLSLLDPWLKEFETCQTPTILYDNQISGNPRVTAMGLDNIESIRLAVNHLLSLGHERIGYLSSALEAYVYRQRYQAFRMVMEEKGLVADDSVMGNAYHVHECMSNHLPRLLESGCTAIICSHDMLANSVMFHCMELGMRVPDDISVMGHDDIPFCRYTMPPLTTIRQNRPALGKSAYYALASQLAGVPMSTLLLHPELILRSSCGPAPNKK